MRVNKKQRARLREVVRKADLLGHGSEPALILIPRILDDLDDAEQRAERAEAELAALRERMRGRAWAFDAMGKHAHAEGLRDLLDDDTTGAASGEGEK